MEINCREANATWPYAVDTNMAELGHFANTEKHNSHNVIMSTTACSLVQKIQYPVTI